jgi:NAD(P)-dependent dehydrogenase (short-subunit alcohol dehydrogenase family)
MTSASSTQTPWQRPLDGRIAIVTGGSRGIGGAISRVLVQDGATVAVLGVPADRERTEALRASLDGVANRVRFYEADVSNHAQVDNAVARVLADHGRVDVLVNNAGIAKDHTVLKMSVEEWNDVIGVDLCGPFYMIRAALPSMVERRYGRIVNISSVVGRTGNFGQANYAAAKAGLLGLTKTVALEVASKGITVNAIAPGFTQTDMVAAMPQQAVDRVMNRTPEQRLAQPQEIARVVRFLVDEGSGFVTGATFDVNGGMYMS